MRPWMRSLRFATIRAAMKLPIPVRRRLAWLTQATFTVGVSALLFNDRDEVLLLRHRFREQHEWELPGGFIGHGENLPAALRRELREETGYEIEVQTLLSARASRTHHLDVCFRARVAGGTLTIDRQEILDARFFAVSDLSDVVAPETLHYLKSIAQRADAYSQDL